MSRTGRFDLAEAETWAGEVTAPGVQGPAATRPTGSADSTRAADSTHAADSTRAAGGSATTMWWRASRPLHPERLSEALERIVDGVVRSRGVVWLANRPTQRLRWESAGYSASLGALGEWIETEHLAECCVVATGLRLDPARLQAVLDACLVTDEELAAGNWHNLDDPFAHVL